MLGRTKNGFSLIEVVLALAVFSFAVIAVVGLVPSGLVSLQSSSADSLALNVLQDISQDIALTTQAPVTSRTSPRYKIPVPIPSTATPPSPLTYYFNDGGVLAASNTTARYKVTVTIIPPGAIAGGGAYQATQVYLRATWPAAAKPGTEAGGVDLYSSFLMN